jgi:hypothetical protein
MTTRFISWKLDDRPAILRVLTDDIALTPNELGLRRFDHEPGDDHDFDSDIDDGHVTRKEM